jgi:hypothetical protein
MFSLDEGESNAAATRAHTTKATSAAGDVLQSHRKRVKGSAERVKLLEFAL